MRNIDLTIFKAYDIRGIYPGQINAELAYRVAQAYAKFINPKTVVVGHDMRLSGEELSQAAINGLIDAGVNVVDIGLVSTDTLYFATVFLNADGGIQITASHNPKEYGGMKMVREKGWPISGDTGMYEIRDMVAAGLQLKSETKGQVAKKDVSEEYLNHVLSIIDTSKIRPLRVVANPNFGMANLAIAKLKERLPLEFVEVLNGQLDGNFPKGRPDPLIPSNRDETIAAIKASRPDLGVAWDGDADRCFFFDENGRFLSGYFTTAVLADYFLRKYPGSKVVVDMKLNWAIKDAVEKAGGEAVTERTGHSFFKAKMMQEQAVFGGEVSGHYYFKDNYFLDNGIMPFLVILEILSTSGQKLSEIYQPFFDRYFAIEETNFTVPDVKAVLAHIKEKYRDAQVSELDGLALEYPDWRCSVRASNTEPIVRLNLEAKSQKVMEQKQQELSGLIESFQ